MSENWIARAEGLRFGICDFVDGRRQAEQTRGALEKYAPRDGNLLYRLNAGTPQDIDAAVKSARSAFEDGRWSHLPLQRRKDALQRLALLMEKHREELALLECLDVGKPIQDALTIDLPMSIALIRGAAEGIDYLAGKVFGADRSSLSYELMRPIGVVAAIVGWNFPLVLAASKVGPALATGNSLILKPSEFTSLSARRLAELAVEAGVPQGVFNVVHGAAAVGEALSLHADIGMVTFTGSSSTGKKLLLASGRSNMKRLLLECGGKAANIVFDDAPDLDAVADRVVARAFWNQGQVCTASSRLLVHERLKDDLLHRVVEKASMLKFGDPLATDTRFGALVNHQHQQKVLAYVSSGEAQGARLVYQANATKPFDGGCYVPPTIFDRVVPEHKIAQEEIFGPVLSVISFRDEAEAIRIANGTIYGLSAIAWTRDLGRAHRVAHNVDVGWLVINACAQSGGGLNAGVKSSGGHKESGLGVEGGIDGLKAYTRQTAVQYFV